MRIAIGAIQHETNSFSPIPTPLEAFHENHTALVEGPQLIELFQGTQSGLGAMLEVAAREGWEVVPTVAAAATPSANIPADVHDALKGALLTQLRVAGPL